MGTVGSGKFIWLIIATTALLQFLYITLAEPPKADVIKFLGIATSVAQIGKVQPEAVTIPRKAEVSFVDLSTGRAYNSVVVLTFEGGHVEFVEKLGEGVQPSITLEELNDAEDIIRKDARVLALAKEVGVEPHQLFAVSFRCFFFFKIYLRTTPYAGRLVYWLGSSIWSPQIATMFAICPLRTRYQSIQSPYGFLPCRELTLPQLLFSYVDPGIL